MKLMALIALTSAIEKFLPKLHLTLLSIRTSRSWGHVTSNRTDSPCIASHTTPQETSSALNFNKTV